MARLKKKAKAFWNWQPSKKLKSSWLWQTLKESKIPALKDAVRENFHVMMRLFWLFIFFTLLGVGGWFIIKASLRIHNEPIEVTVNFKATRTSEQAFPALTHGSRYNLKASSITSVQIMVEKLDFEPEVGNDNVLWNATEVNMLAISVNQFCRPRNPLFYLDETSTFINEDIKEREDEKFIDTAEDETLQKKIVPFLFKNSPKCNDMFATCTWNGNRTLCGDLFRETVTNVGMGCTFNRMPDSVQRTNYNQTLKDLIAPEEKITNEEKEAWKKWDFDNKPFSHFYDPIRKVTRTVPDSQKFGGQRGGLFYVVRMHDKEQHCLQNESGHVFEIHDPREEADLINKGRHVPPNHFVFVVIHPIIITADPDIKDMPIGRRGCVFTDEVKLVHYTAYTPKNCQLECLAAFINETCGCNSITDPKTPTNYLCTNKDKACVLEAEYEFYANKGNRNCFKCLPSCSEISYHTFVTTIPYPPGNPPKIVKQALADEKDSTAVFSVYYEEPHYYHYTRTFKYNWFAIIADIGGNLGLTNGLSFIDMVRILAAIGMFAFPWRKLDRLIGVIWGFIRRKFFGNQVPPSSFLDGFNHVVDYVFAVPQIQSQVERPRGIPGDAGYVPSFVDFVEWHKVKVDEAKRDGIFPIPVIGLEEFLEHVESIRRRSLAIEAGPSEPEADTPPSEPPQAVEVQEGSEAQASENTTSTAFSEWFRGIFHLYSDPLLVVARDIEAGEINDENIRGIDQESEPVSLINEANFDQDEEIGENMPLNEENEVVPQTQDMAVAPTDDARPSFFRRLLKCKCCGKIFDEEGKRARSARSAVSQASYATLITMLDIEESENLERISPLPTVPLLECEIDQEINETAKLFAKEVRDDCTESTTEGIEMDDVSKCVKDEPKDVSPETHNSSEDEGSLTCDVIQSTEIANAERESGLVPVEGPFSPLPLLERWNLLEERERMPPSPTSSSKSESHHSSAK